ncbi:UNVERIFIED_CONTAM: CSC1-like protein [Sesamum indicum]
MNAESLAVSASINIGLALLILTLFSVLRKQPSNAPIYYARLLSQHHQISFDNRFFGFRRLIPSVAWIRRALHVTEDEILDTCGLDVLIFIRLFKFGINFFLVCSVVGLLVLVPLNYIAGDGQPSRRSHSMDAFTISNIRKGSNWLWVHCSCLYFVSCYGLYLLYKITKPLVQVSRKPKDKMTMLYNEYDNILLMRIHQLHNLRHQPNQFTVLVREIPLCDEHKARDCSVDHFFSKYHPHSYQSYQILYDGKSLEKLLSQAKSMRRKIESLGHHSLTEKNNRNSPLSEALKNDAEIEELKEMLQELAERIKHTQSKEVLQEKLLIGIQNIFATVGLLLSIVRHVQDVGIQIVFLVCALSLHTRNVSRPLSEDIDSKFHCSSRRMIRISLDLVVYALLVLEFLGDGLPQSGTNPFDMQSLHMILCTRRNAYKFLTVELVIASTEHKSGRKIRMIGCIKASPLDTLARRCEQRTIFETDSVYQELPVAFVTFKSRWGAALAAQSQQISNPLLWITEMAPEPRDVLWSNLAIPFRYLPLYKFGVYVSASLLTIFFAVPVTAVQGIAKFERLKKWFPPAIAVQLIPGLRSIVTGYLPSVILSGFIYVVPFAMIGMARLAGYISRSTKDIKACNMVFYFLVGNVFFLSLLSGSLLDQIGESFSHPRDIPGRLASAASAQADFFMTYILTNGLSGFSLEVLQPGLLIWDAMKSNTWDRGKKKQPYLYSLPYYRVIPSVALCILIGTVYAVVSPLLLPFLVAYFCLGYIVFINQTQDVYITTYETCGQYWPYIHHYVLIAIVIMQITMIGLFGLKLKPAASFATIPLLVFTIFFNEYCKARFLPMFNHCSVKDARDRDEYDEKTDLMEANLQNAIDAYCPPCLRPLDLEDMESSRLQPLISPR